MLKNHNEITLKIKATVGLKFLAYRELSLTVWGFLIALLKLLVVTSGVVRLGVPRAFLDPLTRVNWWDFVDVGVSNEGPADRRRLVGVPLESI